MEVAQTWRVLRVRPWWIESSYELSYEPCEFRQAVTDYNGRSLHARGAFLAQPASLANLTRPATLDFGTSLMFLVRVGITLYFRRRREIHKRLMVFGSCSTLSRQSAHSHFGKCCIV